MRGPRLPKSQGPTGFSDDQLQQIKRNNAAYAADLTSIVRGLGRKVLGALAVTALERAIQTTYHDSSRFAANWDLAVNRDIYREGAKSLIPHAYGQAPAGQRGDRGANRKAVYQAKAAFYGYRNAGRMVREPVPDGYFWEKLGLHGQVGRPMGAGGVAKPTLNNFQLGAVPRVELFNPIMSAMQGRHDGFGRTYAHNALKTVSRIKGEVQEAGFAVGSGYLPILIKRAKSELATNAKYRK